MTNISSYNASIGAPDLIVQNPIAACCDPTPYICQTYARPKTCASLTNYAMSCGCCGEQYVQADLSHKKTAGSCSLVQIKDASPAPAVPGTSSPRFSLSIKFGCVAHVVTFCNLPADVAAWNSFVYTVLATDGVLLQNNAKVIITAASTIAKDITLQICVDCPGLQVGLNAAGLVGPITAVVTVVAVDDSAPKLGQFVAYGYTNGVLSGIKTYDEDLPYAGFLNLPKNVAKDACCLPTACDCNAIGGCQTIQRTGKVRVPLALPFPTPTAPLVLATKATGEIAVFAGSLASDYVEFPYPYSFNLDPSTVGSTLISVLLH